MSFEVNYINEEIIEFSDFVNNVEDIKPDMRLVEDLGLDSLGATSLVMELEDRYQIEVKNEDIIRFKTVANIYQFVEKALSK